MGKGTKAQPPDPRCLVCRQSCSERLPLCWAGLQSAESVWKSLDRAVGWGPVRGWSAWLHGLAFSPLSPAGSLVMPAGEK